MINYTRQKGFGLMQLLLVVAATGLLSSLVIFVSNTYQSRIRDAHRIADITQIRQGLELYYSQAAGYPDTRVWTIGKQIVCQDTAIMSVPHDPEPWLYYNYKGIGRQSTAKACGNQPVWSTYKLEFHTETDSVFGPAGTYCLRPTQGITPGTCG